MDNCLFKNKSWQLKKEWDVVFHVEYTIPLYTDDAVHLRRLLAALSCY